LRKIFISYRRTDSEGEAGRLFDDLVSRFSDKAVFMDVDAIAPGRDFRRAIEESIYACSVMLVIIGPNWLDAHNGSNTRRLEDEGDFVRIEIATALKRDIPVVPVLVRGAKMIRSEDLPAELRELAYRNAVELTHSRWKSDLQVLGKALEPYIGSADPEPSPVRSAPSPATPSPATNLPAEVVDKIGKELAQFIGPIAGVLVKRAARGCTSAKDLRNTVAAEIPSPADRSKFLSHQS
jgi:hypothetical protein